MSEPLVSICMPVSRGGELLEAAIRSVLEQSYRNLDVVVTDDSGGAVRPVVESFGDERVRYFPNPRRLGLAGNHTRALKEARGEYLGFLHDDDRFMTGYLESIMRVFFDDPSLGVVFTDCWEGLDDEALTRRGMPVEGGRHAAFLPQVIQYGLLPSTTVLRRRVWDEGRHEWPDIAPADMVLFTDAAAAGWPFYYLKEPLAIYSRHDDQLSGDQIKHRGGKVDLWRSYRFEDPEHERVRRSELALWLRARAATHLRARNPRDARADLREARVVDPGRPSPRTYAIELLARIAWLAPAVEAARRRLRPGR